MSMLLYLYLVMPLLYIISRSTREQSDVANLSFIQWLEHKQSTTKYPHTVLVSDDYAALIKVLNQPSLAAGRHNRLARTSKQIRLNGMLNVHIHC
jgi:hypothetical protein